jgi:hypothetical protein
MGNRAVITTADKKLGIYVHWNGGPESIIGFMKACKELKYRNPNDDPSYGFARMSHAIATFFTGETSLGIGPLKNLDVNNFDNGAYIIDKDWNISARYGKGSPSKGTPLPIYENLSQEDKDKADYISNLIVKRIKALEAVE